MKDHEARIDRMLRGLREAEPADGLERRVLRAVEERSAGERPSRRGGLWRVLARAPQSYAVPAVVVVLLVLGAVSWWPRSERVAGHDGAGLARRVKPATMRETAPPVVAAVHPVLRSQLGGAVERRARLVRSGRVPRAPRGVALANHPAPEQPLTDEERLLLRIAQRGAPEEFAALNPDARDAQARSDKAEYRKFFGPPPTGDSE